MIKIPRKFYSRDTVMVAKELLGKRLVRNIDGHELSGIITETEAYGHQNDPASHAAGRMTKRNKVMFEKVGNCYVYFTYGMHYCFNVVARDDSVAAGAVLIRALKPRNGIDMMIQNRKNLKDIKKLTDGPAKLTQAMNITAIHNGMDITSNKTLHITEGIKVKEITESRRIGIKKATDLMWNFKIT